MKDYHLLSNWPSVLLKKFLGISPELNHVVDEGEEGSQGKGADEDGDEPILNHKLQVLVEQPLPSPFQEFVVLLVLRCTRFLNTFDVNLFLRHSWLAAALLALLQQDIAILQQDWHKLRQNICSDLVEDELLPTEDGCQLDGELHEAAPWLTFLKSLAEESVVVVGGPDELPLEEGDVEDGSVVAHRLEEIVLDYQRVVV